jgi:hypothetical protein
LARSFGGIRLGGNQIGETFDALAQDLEEAGGFFLQKLDGFGNCLGKFFKVRQGNRRGRRINERRVVTLKFERDPVMAVSGVAKDLQFEIGEKGERWDSHSEPAFECQSVARDADVAPDFEDAMRIKFEGGQGPDTVGPGETGSGGFEGNQPKLCGTDEVVEGGEKREPFEGCFREGDVTAEGRGGVAGKLCG